MKIEFTIRVSLASPKAQCPPIELLVGVRAGKVNGGVAAGVDFQAPVRLSDFPVIAGEARPSQIAEVLEWAAGQHRALAVKWTELNERG